MKDFRQTYINDAVWNRDEPVTFWGQKVKDQGHGGITHAKTARAEEYRRPRPTQCSVVEL